MRVAPLLVLLLATLPLLVMAIPPLPTEFYGRFVSSGANVTSGTITAKWSGGVCASFAIKRSGGFGLLTCNTDDPATPQVEGPPAGTQISFYYNGDPVKVVSGSNLTSAGAFQFVFLSHPTPFCGDGFCDIFFESNVTCALDCNIPINVSTNVSTNGSTTTTNGSSGGGSGTGGAGGSSGAGGASGSAGSSGSSGSGSSGGSGGGAFLPTAPFPAIAGALAGVVGSTAPYGCQEEWSCTPWSNCTFEGLQRRSCTDANACGTNKDRPAEVQECEYVPTCHDGIQNGDETGLDCGGSLCVACVGCSNGLQDPGEEGVDCGGACRPCDSCFDGVKDYGETGVDCGGPCGACTEQVPPILEFPTLICTKPLSPFENDGGWFLLIVLILTILRLLIYWRELRAIHEDQLLDEFKRAHRYFDRRREIVLFLLIVLAIVILSYGYYYEFLLCSIGYRYLWLYLLAILLAPFIIYAILRWLTYSDGKRLAALRAEKKTHEELLQDMITIENEQILAIETEIKDLIEEVTTDRRLVSSLNKFPEVKKIYEDIVTLYEKYHESKTPTGIEKDLCDQVYAIETNEDFVKLADLSPRFAQMYAQLALLYRHYESKQQMYDELAQLKQEVEERFSSEAGAVPKDEPEDKFGDGGGEQPPSEKPAK